MKSTLHALRTVLRRRPRPEQHRAWSSDWWQAIADTLARGKQPTPPPEASPQYLRELHDHDPAAARKRLGLIATWIEAPRADEDFHQLLAEWDYTGREAHDGSGHFTSFTKAYSGKHMVTPCSDCGVPVHSKLEWRSECGWPPDWMPTDWLPIWPAPAETPTSGS